MSIEGDDLNIAVTGLSQTREPLYADYNHMYPNKLHVVYNGAVPGQMDEPIGDFYYGVRSSNSLTQLEGAAGTYTVDITPTWFADQGTTDVSRWFANISSRVEDFVTVTSFTAGETPTATVVIAEGATPGSYSGAINIKSRYEDEAPDDASYGVFAISITIPEGE